MKFRILFTLFCAMCLSEVLAESELNVKRGVHRFMAYIYYSDETVVDGTGNRFLRSAILFRPDWLVTSAIQTSSNAEVVAFPRKTMLARVGAISIDNVFSFNEDEDEQEREVIQIVRPQNHSATQWWITDITLVKTLTPFNISSAVAPTSLHLYHSAPIDKTCYILIYAKAYNSTDNRMLMQLPVEIQASSIQNCGSHFSENTMICANDIENDKNVLSSSYCQGNNGGPLICEGQIIGLQTYIDNNCNQPHLYQLLAAWDNFIGCGADDKCGEEQCANMCLITAKDVSTTTAKLWTSDTTTTKLIKIETTVRRHDLFEVETTQMADSATTYVEVGAETLASDMSELIANKDDTSTKSPTRSTETTVHTTMPSSTQHSTTTLAEKTEHNDSTIFTLVSDNIEVQRSVNVDLQKNEIKPRRYRSRNSAARYSSVFHNLFSAFILSCCL